MLCYLPRPKPSTLCYNGPLVMPGLGMGVKMYNRSDFTFLAHLSYAQDELL